MTDEAASTPDSPQLEQTHRIAMVVPRYTPFIGGTERHVAELSIRLAARGHRVEVLTTDPNRELATVERMDGVLVRRFRTTPRGGDHFFAPRLAKSLSRRRFDLVHVQGVHSALAPLAMIAATARGLPYIVTFHTGGHPSRLRRRLRGVQWRALAPLLKRAAGLVAVSRFEQAMFADALGVPTDRIRLIPNGADMPAHSEGVEETPDLIVSVGRLEWYKGHHRAIDALPHLLQRRPDARLAIIGSGPIQEELRARAADLGVGDRVSIRSFAPDDRTAMADQLGSAALVVLLSEYEAHPIAIAEALGLGRRVLVADTSGLSDFIADGVAQGVPLDLPPDRLALALDAALGANLPTEIRSLPTWHGTVEALEALYQAATQL